MNNTPKGIIFNIQRFSVHDGPGIRTSVFLKGCPLRCVWCHNPESHEREKSRAYFSRRCTLCARCVKICPEGALSQNGGKIACDREKCVCCGRCADGCAAGAVTVFGSEATVREVISEVMKDRDYYGNSGGGVTFTGGEPMAQPLFLADALAELKKLGVHTAVETSGYSAPEGFELIKSSTDLFLYDLKVMDDALHIKYTGVSNRLILSNLTALSGSGARVLVRIPLVAGCGDSVENISATAEFLRCHTSVREAELIPMHKLAEGKYNALGKKYGALDIPLPDESRFDIYRNIFEREKIRLIKGDE